MTPAPRDPRALELREAAEFRRQMRGLVLLALAVILFVLLRFGLGRVLTPGWWRLW